MKKTLIAYMLLGLATLTQAQTNDSLRDALNNIKKKEQLYNENQVNEFINLIKNNKVTLRQVLNNYSRTYAPEKQEQLFIEKYLQLTNDEELIKNILINKKYQNQTYYNILKKIDNNKAQEILININNKDNEKLDKIYQKINNTQISNILKKINKKRKKTTNLNPIKLTKLEEQIIINNLKEERTKYTKINAISLLKYTKTVPITTIKKLYKNNKDLENIIINNVEDSIYQNKLENLFTKEIKNNENLIPILSKINTNNTTKTLINHIQNTDQKEKIQNYIIIYNKKHIKNNIDQIIEQLTKTNSQKEKIIYLNLINTTINNTTEKQQNKIKNEIIKNIYNTQPTSINETTYETIQKNQERVNEDFLEIIIKNLPQISLEKILKDSTLQQILTSYNKEFKTPQELKKEKQIKKKQVKIQLTKEEVQTMYISTLINIKVNEIKNIYKNKKLPQNVKINQQHKKINKNKLENAKIMYHFAINSLADYLIKNNIENKTIRDKLYKIPVTITSTLDWVIKKRNPKILGLTNVKEKTIETYAKNNPDLDVTTTIHELIHRLYSLQPQDKKTGIFYQELATEFLTRCVTLCTLGVDEEIKNNNWLGELLYIGYEKIQTNKKILNLLETIGQKEFIKNFTSNFNEKNKILIENNYTQETVYNIMNGDIKYTDYIINNIQKK